MTERIGVYFVEIESNHGNTQKDAKETCEKESITLKKKSKRPLFAHIQ